MLNSALTSVLVLGLFPTGERRRWVVSALLEDRAGWSGGASDSAQLLSELNGYAVA